MTNTVHSGIEASLEHADWLSRLAEELVLDPAVAHYLAMDAFGVLGWRIVAGRTH